MNRLRDALLAVSPTLERAIGKRLTTTAGLRDLLARWSTPTQLRKAGKTRIRAQIYIRSQRTAAGLTEKIWKAYKAQTVTVAAEATWGETIAALATDLNRLIDQRNDLKTQIEQAFTEHPLGKVLTSMCGFGPRTGARTLAEIGDPHRFANPARLAAYAGLAPTNYQSGRSRTVRRTKHNNHRLKNAMFMAAFIASRHDPHARAYYNRKIDQGKTHNAAIICLARKRCNIILAMLKTQTPYQPQKLPNPA